MPMPFKFLFYYFACASRLTLIHQIKTRVPVGFSLGFMLEALHREEIERVVLYISTGTQKNTKIVVP